MKILFKLICSLALFFTMAHVHAATYYSRVASFTFAAAGNNWSTSRTGGTLVAYPGTSHNYIIQNGHSVTIGTSQTAAAITVESGATLLSSGNFTITSPLTIDSGADFTIDTRRMTMAGNLTNNGTITITTGRLIRNTFSLTNSGTITMGACQFTASTGSFTNTATGTLTVTGTATITLGTGNFVNDNTSSSVNFGSSAITISGTAANQTIGGFTTTGRFTSSKTAGTLTLTGDINSGGITKSGAGTLNMGSGTHTSTGTIILTAGTMNGGSSTINVNITSTSAWSGTTASVFVPETSTVNFGGVAQTLSATGTKTFYNLTLSNSGLKTLGTTTVNNILSLEGTATAAAAPTYGSSSTLQYNTSSSRTAGAEWVSPFTGDGGVIIANTGSITMNSAKVFNINVPLTINVGATFLPGSYVLTLLGGGTPLINNGTVTPGTSTIIYSNTGSTNIIALNYYNLDGTGGPRILAGTGVIGIANTFTPGAGVYTVTGSTVSFNGAGSQTIPAFNYYNLNGTGGPRTLAGAGVIGIANVFTPGAGSYTVTGSTVSFNGSGPQTIPTFTFNDVILTNSGAKTIDTPVGVKNITIETGPTFNLNSTGGGILTIY